MQPTRATDRPAAVVMNTHYSGLGIARNLGPLGIRVVGVTHMADFEGNRSRWLDYRPAPDCVAQPDALLDVLLGLSRELGMPPVLFPTRDHDIHFINAHRAALEAQFVVPFPAPDVMDRVMNKNRLAEAARSVGIAVPAGITLHVPDDSARARALQFPCVVKPVYASQWRKPGIWEAVGQRKAVFVHSYMEFEQLYARFCHLDPLASLQEWIPGGEDALQIFGSCCGRDGAPKAFFTARKRLQYPALMGTGIVVEALPLPDLEQPSRRLLSALGLFGVSEIEYKRDPRSGRLVLIEINPRHWDQHRVGTMVGVNLSAAAYYDAIGEAVGTSRQGARRVKWIAEKEYAGQWWRCLRGMAPWTQTAAAAFGARTYAICDRHDLGPALAMLGWSNRPANRSAA